MISTSLGALASLYLLDACNDVLTSFSHENGSLAPAAVAVIDKDCYLSFYRVEIDVSPFLDPPQKLGNDLRDGFDTGL